MLLDLFANDPGRTGLSTKSVCAAADIPYTTAWRCLSPLTADGLVERAEDATDARRSLVRLTDRGEAALRLCLESIGQPVTLLAC